MARNSMSGANLDGISLCPKKFRKFPKRKPAIQIDFGPPVFQILRLLGLSVSIYARRFSHAVCQRLGERTVSEAEL